VIVAGPAVGFGAVTVALTNRKPRPERTKRGAELRWCPCRFSKRRGSEFLDRQAYINSIQRASSIGVFAIARGSVPSASAPALHDRRPIVTCTISALPKGIRRLVELGLKAKLKADFLVYCLRALVVQ
jgi:hypothetical protein